MEPVTVSGTVACRVKFPVAGMSCLVALTPSGTAWVTAYWPT